MFFWKEKNFLSFFFGKMATTTSQCPAAMRKEMGEYNRELLVKQKGIDRKRRETKAEECAQRKKPITKKERKLMKQAKCSGSGNNKYVDESLLPKNNQELVFRSEEEQDTKTNTAAGAMAATCAFAEWIAIQDAVPSVAAGSDDWIVVN